MFLYTLNIFLNILVLLTCNMRNQKRKHAIWSDTIAIWYHACCWNDFYTQTIRFPWLYLSKPKK